MMKPDRPRQFLAQALDELARARGHLDYSLPGTNASVGGCLRPHRRARRKYALDPDLKEEMPPPFLFSAFRFRLSQPVCQRTALRPG
jgi:hypothetical protein